MFKRFQTIEGIDGKIRDLQKLRRDLLARREALVIDAVDHPERINEKEWTRCDMQLQGIPAQITQLEAQRAELEQKARRKEYEALLVEFQSARALAQKIADGQRREIARVNILPGIYVRFLNQQTDIVSGFQGRCLSLLTQLDMTPDEQTHAREALLFSRLDLGGDISAHQALYESMLPELVAELEKEFGVTLGVIDG